MQATLRRVLSRLALSGLRDRRFVGARGTTATTTAAAATTTAAASARGVLGLGLGGLATFEVDLAQLLRRLGVLERDLVLAQRRDLSQLEVVVGIGQRRTGGGVVRPLLDRVPLDAEEAVDEAIDVVEREQRHVEHVGRARAGRRVGRLDQEQAAALAVDTEDRHQAAETRGVVLPVAGLALEPEQAAVDCGHDVGLELAAVRQRTLHVVEQLVLGRAHRRAQAPRQQARHVNLKPAAGQELADLTILGRDHAQLLLRRAVVVEILQHAVPVQQGAELHRRRPLGRSEAVDVNPLAAPGRHATLDLLVEVGQRLEVGAEVAGEMLKGLVPAEVVLPLIDQDAPVFEVVDQQTGGRVVRHRPRLPPLRLFIASGATAATLTLIGLAAVTTTTAPAPSRAATAGGPFPGFPGDSCTSLATESFSEQGDFCF